MITLPKAPEKPKDVNPTTLGIFGYPKTGKSRIVTGLTNYLIIDLEEGQEEYQTSTKKYDSSSICIKTYAGFVKLLEHMKQQKASYDYLIIDSFTRLQDVLVTEAKAICKKQNRSYEAHGSGLATMKDLMRTTIDDLTLYGKYIIFLGHIMDKNEQDQYGQSETTQQVMLTGDMKIRVPSQLDAIAQFVREGYTGYLQFNPSKPHEGSRSDHLTGKKIKISEYDPTNHSLKTFWEDVYVEGNQSQKFRQHRVDEGIQYIKNNISIKTFEEWETLLKTSTQYTQLEKDFIISKLPELCAPINSPQPTDTDSGKNEAILPEVTE